MNSEEAKAITIAGYDIRECATFKDFNACMAMQRNVWQFEPLDVTPLRSYIITRISGGFTLGAFDKSDRLIGFVHALPAFDQQLKPYYYSQMLAVEPSLQNAGVGVRLKLAQREYALKRNVPLMTWTFDPLQSRNAYLNIAKLGGVIRNYQVNFYGNESTSTLHRGLDTDRLYIQWWVKSQHVAEVHAGKQRTDPPQAVIEVPRDIGAIKNRDLEEAHQWQLRIRAEFQRYLNEGLYCAGFKVDPNGGNSYYLLFKDDHREEG